MTLAHGFGNLLNPVLWGSTTSQMRLDLKMQCIYKEFLIWKGYQLRKNNLEMYIHSLFVNV